MWFVPYVTLQIIILDVTVQEDLSCLVYITLVSSIAALPGLTPSSLALTGLTSTIHISDFT